MAGKDEKKKGFWSNAFKVEKAEDFVPTERDMEILDFLAKKVAKRSLTTPAILFLESARPLNFIGAQAMAFFEPIVRGVFSSWKGYSDFYKLMEKRGSVEILIDRIEHFENLKQEENAGLKAEQKANKAKEKQKKEV